MSADVNERLMQSAAALAPVLAPALVAWQRGQGRHHLPWQHTRDPYRVWLSEIMLQQTQVSTVLGYYDRFLARFPDVRALAAAPEDEVLALWSGLGYYSRARNLHRCAQVVCEQHGGVFPDRFEALKDLPGIGPSTAAAVAAFCFHERVSIMDGNVKRVLARVLDWGQDLSVTAHARSLERAAALLVPEQGDDMPAYTQGLMDLGATVCLPRRTDCLLCPWADPCRARAAGRALTLPVKSRKLQRGRREHWWLWIEHDGHVWLTQRPDQGVWARLWSLPLVDDEAAVGTWATALGVQTPEIQPAIDHALTHLDWRLHPRRLVLSARPDPQCLPEGADGRGRWVPLAALADWGLPAPARRLLTGR